MITNLCPKFINELANPPLDLGQGLDALLI